MKQSIYIRKITTATYYAETSNRKNIYKQMESIRETGIDGLIISKSRSIFYLSYYTHTHEIW